MQTIAKITRYSYENKIPLEQRERILQWYEQGYAIRRIAMALAVRTDSIRHHLKAFGVLETHRKVKQWNKPIKNQYISKHFIKEDIALVIDVKMPLNIQRVYIKMNAEDNEMRNRKPKRLPRNHIPHKHILADRVDKFDNARFKSMYTFEL